MWETTDITVPASSGVRRHLANVTSRNTLAEILQPTDILLGLDVATKSEALLEIARFIGARHQLSDVTVHASLVEREEMGSTGLGCGVAIPHARVDGLDRPVAAFIRTQTAIPFDAPDGKPVADMIVLLVPHEATDEHLLLLAEIAELFVDKRFREKLRNCADAGEVRATLLDAAERDPLNLARL